MRISPQSPLAALCALLTLLAVVTLTAAAVELTPDGAPQTKTTADRDDPGQDEAEQGSSEQGSSEQGSSEQGSSEQGSSEQGSSEQGDSDKRGAKGADSKGADSKGADSKGADGDGKKGPKKAAPVTTRRVAIGDIHGDHRTFRKLLRDLELIDEKDHWSGGKQHFVQTGDIVDRGPDSRRSIELLMRLEKESRAAGGSTTILLGNHEVMNLVGELTYVAPGEYAAFGAEETPALRAERRTRLLALIGQGSPLLRSSYYRTLARRLHARNFDRYFPRGYFAHRRAFSRKGKIGRWLLEHEFVKKIGNTLFLHAGISPRYARLSAKDINRMLREDLKTFFDTVEELSARDVFDPDLGFAELFSLISSERKAGGPDPQIEPLFAKLEKLNRSSLLLASDGPIWYRGLAENDEQAFADSVEQILELQKVERIVVGHTQPKSLRIEGRFGGSVILIDTGMNQKSYGGRPSALIFQSDGSVRVFE
jgi:hypothetical protein